MIEVVSNGETFNGFTKISVSDSIDQLCSEFGLECTASTSQVFPIKKGSEVLILIDGEKLITGIVEVSEGSYSSDSFSIKLNGRDITKEVLKTDLAPDFVLKGEISLETIMNKTIEKTNLGLIVIDETDGLDDFTDKEIMTDDVGSTVWDFWVALAEKRQVLLSKDKDGNILIYESGTKKYDAILKNTIIDNDNTNNILDGSWSFNDSERRAEYNVYSQANISVPRKEDPPDDGDYWTPESEITEDPELQNKYAIEDVQAQLAVATPGTEVFRALRIELRVLNGGKDPNDFVTKRVQTQGRTLDLAVQGTSVAHETAENPSDSNECQRLADWNCNKKRVESVSYSCTVQSLLVDGETWKAGYLISVNDEVASVKSLMLIQSVNYSSSVSDSGDASESVELTLTIPDGYSANANPTDGQNQTSFIGDNWVEDFEV